MTIPGLLPFVCDGNAVDLRSYSVTSGISPGSIKGLFGRYNTALQPSQAAIRLTF